MERQNLKISGASTIAGGEYSDIRASGALKCAASVDCRSLHASGAVKIEGSLNCACEAESSGSVAVGGDAAVGSLRSSGSVKVGGALDCKGTINASGSVKVGQTLTVAEIKTSGSLHCEELHAASVKTSGALVVRGGVEAERFHSSGKLEIGGLLNAEEIDIAVSAVNEVADIGCSKITVHKDWWGIALGARPALRVKSIEGDVVELESTVAEVVRGRYVRIGTDCKIDRVEYTEDLTIEGGTVGEQVKQ